MKDLCLKSWHVASSYLCRYKMILQKFNNLNLNNVYERESALPIQRWHITWVKVNGWPSRLYTMSLDPLSMVSLRISRMQRSSWCRFIHEAACTWLSTWKICSSTYILGEFHRRVRPICRSQPWSNPQIKQPLLVKKRHNAVATLLHLQRTGKSQ